jgi:uracil-DNA glycosylase family 4
MPSALHVLHQEVILCRRCPRLVEYREAIGREKRRAYLDCEYWARPVPGFGDPQARVVILGLAPGAHGSNRTGRPFTGDSSGRFMYPILHRTGFASQPNADSRNDGLRLFDAYITAAVRCAPPQNKPTPREIANCAPFLDRELRALKRMRVLVALGRIGFDAYLNHLQRVGVLNAPQQAKRGLPPQRFKSRSAGDPSLKSKSAYRFAHGASYTLPNGVILLASYHPSNQNTATGKLTAAMFEQIFLSARQLVSTDSAMR